MLTSYPHLVPHFECAPAAALCVGLLEVTLLVPATRFDCVRRRPLGVKVWIHLKNMIQNATQKFEESLPAVESDGAGVLDSPTYMFATFAACARKSSVMASRVHDN